MFQHTTCDVFISYAAADREWVHGYLIPALGLPPDRMITPEDFRPGAPVVAEFERAVTDSCYTLLVLSPAYLADEWATFSEQLIQHASVEEQRHRLIPLRLQPSALPLRINFRISLDYTSEANWVRETDRLRALLDQPPPPPEHIACPYPGMVPFSTANARFFYGREAEIRQMVQHLRYQRLLFVIGPSGSGKSSLVFAGLLPELAWGHHFPKGFWQVRHMRPGAQPMEMLVQIVGDLQHPAPLIKAALAKPASAERLLLIVDQFEELFTQAPHDEQLHFIEAIQALRAVEECMLLFTMRADFYPDLMNSSLWPIDVSQRLEIAPLRGDALRKAIRQPAADVGVYMEQALVERLLHDAANQPGILPLIQETMRLLWNERRQRLLTLSAYEQLGRDGRSGLAVAVATKADATLAELTPVQQRIARRIFLSLVQLGEGGPDTRRRQPQAELGSASDDPRDFDRVLEHLTHNRLLTRSSDDTSHGPMVDLSHEALITGWPRLRMWLEEGREDLLLHRRLAQAADDWRKYDHDASFLYGGSRLKEAQRFAEEHPQDLSQNEIEFLAASAAREAVRERSRYLGQAAGGAVGAALGFSLTFALSAWLTKENATTTLTVFLSMSPVGGLVGFGIGIGLWIWRHDLVRRVAITGLIGALISSVTYSLLLLYLGRTSDYRSVVAGAFLGAGLGLGAALDQRRRLLGTILGSFLAAVLALGTEGLAWGNWYTIIIFGLVLGGLTGLGFETTAVEDNEFLVI